MRVFLRSDNYTVWIEDIPVEDLAKFLELMDDLGAKEVIQPRIMVVCA